MDMSRARRKMEKYFRLVSDTKLHEISFLEIMVLHGKATLDMTNPKNMKQHDLFNNAYQTFQFVAIVQNPK